VHRTPEQISTDLADLALRMVSATPTSATPTAAG
jgi:hypothetical protein